MSEQRTNQCLSCICAKINALTAAVAQVQTSIDNLDTDINVGEIKNLCVDTNNIVKGVNQSVSDVRTIVEDIQTTTFCECNEPTTE